MNHDDPKTELRRTETAPSLPELAEQITPRGVRVIHSPDHRIAGRAYGISGQLRLGRESASGVDVAIHDPLLSRSHARLTRRGNPPVYAVEDLDSKNGIFVDGQRVDGSIMLHDGAIVRLGGTMLEFGLQDLGADQPPDDPVLVGRSLPLRRVLDEVDRVGPTDLSALILGETGTGKELVAHRLHERSGRNGRFVAVNCGAIPANLMESYLFGHKKGAFTGASQDAQGYFATAQLGTLFLDEVGELPLELQPKLLRVLETQEFRPVGSTTSRQCDVRIVAATNVDLRKEVEANRFRRDLYARLAGYTIHLPPLRFRRGDIPLLTSHFFWQLRGERPPIEMSPAFLEQLVLYDWPMNVRELRSVIQRLALLQTADRPLQPSDLPEEMRARLREQSAARDASTHLAPGGVPARKELAHLLEQHGGMVARLADHYGRDRKQVYRWLKKYGLDPDAYRSSD